MNNYRLFIHFDNKVFVFLELGNQFIDIFKFLLISDFFYK